MADINKISDFIQFNSNGLSYATYQQIRQVLASKLRELYGEDIDLSQASADGQLLENATLFDNTIIQTIAYLEQQLNPNTATGKYLDILCSLSNVYRKPATQSTCEIILTNSSSSDIIIPDEEELVDDNGVIWYVVGSQTIPGNGTTTCKAICSEYGEIPIPANSIKSFSQLISNIVVSQPNQGDMGTTIESDNDLRSRRSNQLSLQGLSTQSSLESILLQYVDDVLIIQNREGSPKTSEVLINDEMTTDMTSIPGHSIYVILRYKKDSQVSDSFIANILNEQATLGCNINFDVLVGHTFKDGEKKEVELNHEYQITVSWKKATPTTYGKIHIDMIMQNFEPTESDLKENTIVQQIFTSINDFLTKIRLGRQANTFDLANDIIYSNKDYVVTLNGLPYMILANNVRSDTIVSRLSYFDYTLEDLVVSYDATNKILTFEIGEIE